MQFKGHALLLHQDNCYWKNALSSIHNRVCIILCNVFTANCSTLLFVHILFLLNILHKCIHYILVALLDLNICVSGSLLSTRQNQVSGPTLNENDLQHD